MRCKIGDMFVLFSAFVLAEVRLQGGDPPAATGPVSAVVIDVVPDSAPCLEIESVTCAQYFSDIPPICGDQPCEYLIVRWEASPMDPDIEVPVLEYRCKVIEGQPTVGSHDVHKAQISSCSKAAVGNGYPDYNDANPDLIICFNVKTCALECKRSADVGGYIANRWREGANSSGDPGTTPWYKGGCADGFQSGTDHKLMVYPCKGVSAPCESGPPPLQ